MIAAGKLLDGSRSNHYTVRPFAEV